MSLEIKATKADFGAIFHDLRVKHKLNQGELAEKIGVGQATISKLESGKSEIGVLLFFKLLECFGVSAGSFSKLLHKRILVTNNRSC